MKPRRYPLAAVMLVVLAACRPGAAEYTESEAPNRLGVDAVTSRVDLRFAPRSARLAPRDAARVHRLVATGAILPSDRVTIAVSGSPGLAAARTTAIAHELARDGIVAQPLPAGNLAPGRAVIAINRAVVTLPPCPNWSKPPAADFTNALTSNYGCANASNFGQMVATPSELIAGTPLGPAVATPATSAVERYLTDRVLVPSTTAVGPIAVATPTAAPPAAPAAAP